MQRHNSTTQAENELRLLEKRDKLPSSQIVMAENKSYNSLLVSKKSFIAKTSHLKTYSL